MYMYMYIICSHVTHTKCHVNYAQGHVTIMTVCYIISLYNVHTWYPNLRI